MKQVWAAIKKIGTLETFLLMLFILNPIDKGVYIGYLLTVVILIKTNYVKTIFDFDTVIILLFSLTYGLFYALNPLAGVQYVIFHLAFPFILFIWGKYFVSKLNGKQVLNSLMFIAFLFSFNAFVSVLLYIAESGFQSSRDVPMFWSSVAKNPTGTSAFFTFLMCYPAIVVASQNYKLLQKMGFLVLFILGFISILRLGSRTQIALVFIHLAITILFIIPKQSFKRTFGIFLVFLLTAFVIYQNVSFDLDSQWLAAFESRLKSGENNASAGNRTELWSHAIEKLAEHPFGYERGSGGFAHNTWLEIGRIVGVIPLAIFILFCIRMAVLLKNVVSKKYLTIDLRICLLTFLLGAFTVFMVEPIIVGSLHFFLIFCFLCGMLKEINKRNTVAPAQSP